jgi:hypothetical protein
MTYTYRDEEHRRNASIQIREEDLGDGFSHEVVAYHETWTGHEWLPIVNKDYAYDAQDAEQKADRMAAGLGYR